MEPPTLTDALAETLAVFDASGAPQTTEEVADRLDLGRRSTYDRLDRLADGGHIETKKVGASARVWWCPVDSGDVAETERAPESEHGTGEASQSTAAAADRGDRAAFESFVDAVEEYAIFRLDPEGRVRTWNDGARRIKGYETEEIVGEHFSTFYTEADRETGVPAGNLTDAAESGSVEDEGWRVRADGTRFWANVTITAVHGDDGDLEGYVKVTRDMTERREYEQRLEEEKSFVESILDNQQDLVYAYDTDGTFFRWNDSFSDVTGYADEEIETMRPEEFIADGAVEETATAVERILEDGETVTVELPLETADGDVIPYEFTGGPITDENGDVVGGTGVGRDVSDRRARVRRLERQRDELENELREVFERVDDAFFALDEEWRFTHLNDRAAELLDQSVGELLGRSVWDVFPAAVGSTFQREYERALDTQEAVSFEEYFPPLDTWFEVSAYPSESGLSVYFRDVTDRTERERELVRYRTLFEESRDVNAVVDPDGRFRHVTPSVTKVLGYEPGELVGDSVFDYVHPEDRERAVTAFERTVEHTDDEPRAEFRFEHRDGSWVTLEAIGRNLLDDPDIEGIVVYTHDVTDRVERERRLERYETVLETVEDGVYVMDEDGRFTMVNDAYCELTGYDREQLLGEPGTKVVDPETVEQAASIHASLSAGDRDAARLEAPLETADGRTVPAEATFSVVDSEGDDTERVGVVRDMSERRRRERELQQRIDQQETVADLGQRALEGGDVDELMTEAVERVADVLGTDYCKVLDLDADSEELLLRQGVGWDEGIVGRATVSTVEDDSQAAYTLASREPVVVEDLATEARFGGPDLLRDHDVRSGISVVIGSQADPWGILGTHDTDRRTFDAHHVTFVQSVATILATAVNRHRDERALRRQRERLAALDSLNRTVREITEAVIDQSTREEIERTVCEHLAAADSYEFAWVGGVDAGTNEVTLRTEAGVEGYLDGVTITVDPDDDRSEGPTGRALRTGEMQTTDDVDASSDHDPWREHVDRYEFRSSAAVPVVHEDTVYGVLNVYAGRPHAFEGQEGAVVEQLGEVVGHAIAAAERKRALMSDELVELEFRIRDVFSALDVPVETEGHVALDSAVPVNDDEFLVYGTATPDAVGVLSAVETALPHWDAVTVDDADEDADRVDFRVRLTDPPVLSAVASVGGYVDQAVIEEGDYRMTVHIAPSVEVSRIVDAVTAAYQDAELLRRQQVDRTDDDVRRAQRRLTTDLTERQRTALEVAYHSGFFEWPRDADGTAVAESLGVSPPTFHQHLRKAEYKVLGSLFGARGET